MILPRHSMIVEFIISQKSKTVWDQKGWEQIEITVIREGT